MAVLVQEIIQADYAFVVHTTNPSTEDETEIYAEVKLKDVMEDERSTLSSLYWLYLSCRREDMSFGFVLVYFTNTRTAYRLWRV